MVKYGVIGDPYGISTGFDKLDEMTNGLQNANLVIVSGESDMGKTAFALSIAKNIAAGQNIPMAFFSLEMSNVQLLNRFISNACEIEGRKILNGKLNKEDWERLDKTLKTLIEVPLYIDDSEGLSVQDLKSKACCLARDKGIKLIMIDYLQLMTISDISYNSRQKEIFFILDSLKNLAKELNIPILVLHQLDRGSELVKDYEVKRPQLSDIREYDAIEQNADIVIFLHRPNYRRSYECEDGANSYQEKIDVIIAKNHKGATGIIQMDYEVALSRIDN